MTMQELKKALIRVDKMRKERERKIAQADEIEEQCLSVGASHVFDNIGASHQPSRHSPQERMAEALDLRRSAWKDLELIDDVCSLLSDEVDKIKDLDTRWVIRSKYICGDSMKWIAGLYVESKEDEKKALDFVYEVERKFFAS